MKRSKMKFTHHIHSQGGPWTTTDFLINGVHVGSLRSRSRVAREQEVDRFQKMTQDELRALLKKRIGVMVKSIEEVEVVLESVRHLAEIELEKLS